MRAPVYPHDPGGPKTGVPWLGVGGRDRAWRRHSFSHLVTAPDPRGLIFSLSRVSDFQPIPGSALADPISAPSGEQSV